MNSVIESSRFYCVSCGRIVSVATNLDQVKDEICGVNQVFRTGFYRSEMPLGCCGTCQVQTKRQENAQFTGQYTKDYDTLNSYEKRA
ncbi:hypothetical protein [Paenibacillus tundrae]|uniref:hypothetical protein n=1 Tax=Paenibacillus tundrae TaxID=528187 RepID=UPI0027D7FF8F|nr:hypothetical protein [Paenibacillus tundrae]